MDKGFGDTFERFTKATGIRWLTITITGWLGINCGCKYRKDLLNKWFPYKQNKMNKKITIEDILDPITPGIFFKEYWGKKHLILRRNKFKNLFTWNDFGKYMNQYPDIKGLQIIGHNKEKDGRWCLNKVRSGKMKQPMLSKDEVFKLWKEEKSFVIPLAEYQKEGLHDICREFERYFMHGQANMYCSPSKNSISFPPHADNTENFLFHTEGKVKWRIYKEFAPKLAKTLIDEFVLEAGDLLYIPQYQYHEVEPIGPRILISIHFKNKPKQNLQGFKVSPLNAGGRRKWYDWNPVKHYDDNGFKTEEYRHNANAPTWKDKYFK